MFFVSVLNADIQGVGYGATKEESKNQALADLVGNIKSEVRTNFESTLTDESESSKFNVKVNSNLPVLGAVFTYEEQGGEYRTKALLKKSSSKKLYLNKLDRLKDDIDALLKDEKNSKNADEKIKIFESVYSLLNEYERYKSVADILGVETKNNPSISRSQVQIKLEKLSSNVDSIELASDILAKSFKAKKIFVYPPMLENTTMVSEFGMVFQKALKAKLDSVSSTSDAQSILVGEYTLTENMMVLNYELLDVQNNEVKGSKTISINKSAYKKIKVEPRNISFDKLLNSGIASSSALKVSLNSNRGSQNLLFKANEEIELFVKLNKMGYFYIVGYTQTTEGSFSYLLELNEGVGSSRFVKFVNADDANRWMSLGSFVVEPPYGIESIQVIASNKKIDSLPNTSYDEQSGYYIISSDIKKAVAQTRGLKKKKSSKKEMSEDVMSFTTVEDK
jgi:hypothetical protein